MKTLFEAVGPEQVSPHYESLSRSRRGLIFLFAYIGSITSISRLGGWSHNEWIRGLIYHHEFLIAWYIGFLEIRHFSFMFGPKFTNFYNVYTRYETTQLCNQWADVAEEVQATHLVHTKEQIEYIRVNKEYDFVKKRALVNFLANSRENLDQHFHSRTQNMLNSIEMYEQKNLKNLLGEIGSGAQQKLQSSLSDPSTRKVIDDGMFQSALLGIRKGEMTYENDPLLPLVESEIQSRTAAFAGLSAEEESKMLALNDDQKKIIAGSDKATKTEFLRRAPKVTSAGVKLNPKFIAFCNQVIKAE